MASTQCPAMERWASKADTALPSGGSCPLEPGSVSELAHCEVLCTQAPLSLTPTPLPLATKAPPGVHLISTTTQMVGCHVCYLLVRLGLRPPVWASEFSSARWEHSVVLVLWTGEGTAEEQPWGAQHLALLSFLPSWLLSSGQPFPECPRKEGTAEARGWSTQHTAGLRGCWVNQ